VLVAALLGGAIAAGFWGFSYDDAFVTYRYAQRLAQGAGLTYNPGERVLGTSAPGFAVALGVLSWLGRPLGWGPPEWGTLLGVLSIAATSLLPMLAARSDRDEQRDDDRDERAVRVGFVAASVSVVGAALSLTMRWNVELLGAETLPVLALVGGAAVLARSGRHDVAAGLLVALAATLRLDALLGGGALGAALWWRRRRLPVAYASTALVPVALWLVLLWLAFGAVVPSTLAAKQSELAADTPGYTLAQWRWLTRTMPASSAFALAALALAGAWALVRGGRWRDPALLAGAGWILTLEVFYRVVAVPFAPWYHLPTIGALLLLAACGAVAVGRVIATVLGVAPVAAQGTTQGTAQSTAHGAAIGRSVAPQRSRVALAFAAPAAALLVALPVLAPSLSWLASAWGEPPDPRYQIYRRVGVHLAAATDGDGPGADGAGVGTSRAGAPGASTGAHRVGDGRVAAVEIGVLGYFSGRPILDLVGLVSPQARRARAEGRLDELLLETPPAAIVDVPLFHREHPVLADPEVRRRYVEGAAFEDQRSGRGRVVVLGLRPGG
jgi:hypothetical protein